MEARVLNQAVKRNMDRFPADFLFQLNREEAEAVAASRSQTVILDGAAQADSSQSVISSGKRRGQNFEYLPYAFTEQGVAMLSSVLRSPRAVAVNIAIMRTFVQLRLLMDSNRDLARKIESMEQKYDEQFTTVFEAMIPKPASRLGGQSLSQIGKHQIRDAKGSLPELGDGDIEIDPSQLGRCKENANGARDGQLEGAAGFAGGGIVHQQELGPHVLIGMGDSGSLSGVQRDSFGQELHRISDADQPQSGEKELAGSRRATRVKALLVDRFREDHLPKQPWQDIGAPNLRQCRQNGCIRDNDHAPERNNLSVEASSKISSAESSEKAWCADRKAWVSQRDSCPKSCLTWNAVMRPRRWASAATASKMDWDGVHTESITRAASPSGISTVAIMAFNMAKGRPVQPYFSSALHRIRLTVGCYAMLFLSGLILKSAHAQGPVLIQEVISREHALFIGADPDFRETISREVALFMGADPDAKQVVSREVSLAMADGAAPPLVTNVQITLTLSSTRDSVTLDWSPYNQWSVRDVAQYAVYFSTSYFTSTVGLTPRLVPGENFTTTFAGLPVAADFFFAVVPVDALGNAVTAVTPKSNYALMPEVISRETALFNGHEPYPPLLKEVISREISLVMHNSTAPPGIPLVGLTVSNTRGTATLDWGSYNQWEVRDVQHYAVYYTNTYFTSTAGLTPFRIVPGETLATVFTNMPVGQDYFFAVVPVDAAGNAVTVVTPTGDYALSKEVISRDAWGELLGDLPSAGAILDRLLHHAEIIAIEGRSHRLAQRAAEQTQKLAATPKPE